jgi:peroxiredoxin
LLELPSFKEAVAEIKKKGISRIIVLMSEDDLTRHFDNGLLEAA